MAVILRRIGTAALVFIALVLPALKKDPPQIKSESEERGLRLRKLRAELGSVAYRWSALTERDSALALSVGAMPGQPPRILLRGFPTGARSPVAEEIVNGLWKQLGRPDSTVAVSVVLYSGEGYSQRFRSYAGTSIRFDGPAARCVAIMAGELRKNGVVLAWRESLTQVLSPCLLLAGFGPPGKGIRRWLEATRFGMASSAGWLTRPITFLDGNGGIPWQLTADFYAGWDGGQIMRGGFPFSIAANRLPPYYIGGMGLRCLNSDPEACRASVVGTLPLSQVGQSLPSDLTLSEWRMGGKRGEFLGPVPVAHYWVSDVIRDQGREKFRRFWKSDLPFEPAFQASFGDSLGEWTAGWARQQWDGSWQAKHGSPTLTLGTDLAPSWPLLVAGWSALILLGAVSAANRRQST